MAHHLCINCCQKFDDEKSYAVREIVVPAYLTKSCHEEVLSLHRPVCPHCGAQDELLSMEAMRAKTRAGLPARSSPATAISLANTNKGYIATTRP